VQDKLFSNCEIYEIKKDVFVIKPITTEGKILPSVETLKELNQVKQYLKGV